MTAAELVRACAEHLLPGLVSNADLQQLTDAARVFPPVSGLIFEGRSSGGPLDLSLRILREHGEPERWLEHIREHSFDQHPLWRGVSTLLERWIGANENTEYAGIENLWLEFDAAVYGIATPPPLVFVNARRFSQSSLEMILKIDSLLAGRPATVCTETAIRSTLRSIPAGRLHWIGYRYARDIATPRITFSVTLPELPAFMRAADARPGPILTALMKIADEFRAALTWNTDVGDNRRFGLELQAGRQNEWWPCLEALASAGIINTRRARDWAQWPGASPEFSGGVPAGISLRVPEDDRRPLLVRRISHIKCVFEIRNGAANIIETKVYLYAGFGWL